MTIPDVLDVARDFLMTAMMISMPALIVSLVIGVVIAILQTITSVQEQTLSFVAAFARSWRGDAGVPGLDVAVGDSLHGAHAGDGGGGRALIDSLVMTWALTLARVGTFMYFLPLLGGPNVPRTVKIGLSMALTVCCSTAMRRRRWRRRGAWRMAGRAPGSSSSLPSDEKCFWAASSASRLTFSRPRARCRRNSSRRNRA